MRVISPQVAIGEEQRPGATKRLTNGNCLWVGGRGGKSVSAGEFLRHTDSIDCLLYLSCWSLPVPDFKKQVETRSVSPPQRTGGERKKRASAARGITKDIAKPRGVAPTFSSSSSSGGSSYITGM